MCSITLDFDPSVYTKSSVEVQLRRNPATGFTESAEQTWTWSVKSKHGDGEQRVKATARASAVRYLHAIAHREAVRRQDSHDAPVLLAKAFASSRHYDTS
jgi:hypothetical protein